jgi:beta-phosphoglucomutase
MIRACIFDLDGVLVDTAHYHFLAWRRLANQLGFDFDEKANEALKGVGRMESLDIILGWGGLSKTRPEKEALAHQKNEWYRAYIREMTPGEVLPGVAGFLDQLDAQGIRKGIGSSSKNAKTILRQVGLTDRFEVIVDGTDLQRSKPDPQVFQLGAERLGLSPRECIVFEDAAAGIEAALAGGFWAVGVGDAEIFPGAHIAIPGLENLHWSALLEKLPL